MKYFFYIIYVGDTMYADVLVELKAKGIDQTFTYKIPNQILSTIQVGVRVLVPFGKQELEGFVLKINSDYEGDFQLKEIIKQIDEQPVLNEEMLELGKYMSKKTLTNLITCYQTMLPSALKAKHNLQVSKKYCSYILLGKEEQGKTESQKKIIEMFKKEKKVPKKVLSDISVSSLNTLLKKGILVEEKEEVYRFHKDIQKEKNNYTLTESQKKAIETIYQSTSFQTYLLHGVTGSGKTEVYMNVIEEVLKKKKEALVLVPEISLTPQLVETFEKRFGDNVAILHSNLSMGEKYDEWRRIERKEVSIVIGARSAIFAPLTNLGIIIIDEEHSSTYKQENNPKYNTVDIAIYRAKKYNIPLVLGSATPLIESYTRAKTGIYELIQLKNKITNTEIETHLVDMREEIKNHHPVLSRILEEKIKEALEQHHQVLLLLNRRGYTTVTTCKNCGYVHKCKYCDIPLTYHKTSNMMRCHYCGYAEPILKVCPECASKNINSYGMGTEKLVEYIEEHFKEAKVVRMDNDTTSKKGSHEQMIHDFENQKYNILIGTQMISKGLNFKNVSVVGVISGDSSLNLPDFRSAERTFALINQVMGRAGRFDLKGTVIVQGFNIDHYSIVKAIQNDYEGFYLEELKIRKMLKYSPFYNLTSIKIRNKDYEKASLEANKIAAYLRKENMSDTYILGPAPAMIPKINNVYELQIILKYKKSDKILKILEEIKKIYQTNKITVDIDINPYLL